MGRSTTTGHSWTLVEVADQLIKGAIELAKEIALWPPVAMRSAKRVVQQNLGLGLEEALRNETRGLEFARRAPHDVKEARLSFVERRKPDFTGKEDQS